jgi:hypothetical protein
VSRSTGTDEHLGARRLEISLEVPTMLSDQSSVMVLSASPDAKNSMSHFYSKYGGTFLQE